MEVIWIIPTTVQRFKTWFLEYFKQYVWRATRVDLDDSSHIVFTLKPPQLSQFHDDKAFITVDTEYKYLSVDGTEKELETLLPAFSLRLIQLDHGKIEITAKFHFPSLNTFYKSMMGSIENRWNVVYVKTDLNLSETEGISRALSTTEKGDVAPAIAPEDDTDKETGIVPKPIPIINNPINTENLDATDKKILAIVEDDPDITDKEVGLKINLGRQAVNRRRRKLKAMGFRVR